MNDDILKNEAQLYERAKSWFEADVRCTSRDEWAKAVREAHQIRDNEWDPKEYGGDNIDGYIFKLNFHQKTVDLINGKLFGQPVKVRMEGVGEDDSLNAEVASHAINWALEKSDAHIKNQEMIEHFWWDGMIVHNCYLDSKTWDKRLINGVPRYELVDPTSIVLDSDCTSLLASPHEGGMKKIHRYRRLPIKQVIEDYNLPEDTVITGDTYNDDGGTASEGFEDGELGEKVSVFEASPNGSHCTVVETQFMRTEWRTVLPLETDTGETMQALQVLVDVLMSFGMLEEEEPYLSWTPDLRKIAEEIGVLDVLKKTVIRKRMWVVYRIDWAPGYIDKLLEGPVKIEFYPGSEGKLTYSVLPFRQRRGKVYPMPATHYSKELFFMTIYFYTLIMQDAKDALKSGGVYVKDAFDPRTQKLLNKGARVFAGVNADKLQDLGLKPSELVHRHEHKGLNSAFMQLGQLLQDEWHEQNYSGPEQTGQVAYPGAPAALQDILQSAGHVPMMPLMNSVKWFLQNIIEKFFALLRYLPVETQIKIAGPKNSYLTLNQPVHADEYESIVKEQPDLYSQYIQNGMVRPLDQSQIDEDGFVLLNTIDGEYDTTVDFETDSIVERRNKALSLREWYEAGLLDRKTPIEENPDILEDADTILERIDEENGMKQIAELMKDPAFMQHVAMYQQEQQAAAMQPQGAM